MFFDDDLPVWGFVGKVEPGRRQKGGAPSESRVFLFTHFHFDISYNEDQARMGPGAWRGHCRGEGATASSSKGPPAGGRRAGGPGVARGCWGPCSKPSAAQDSQRGGARQQPAERPP
jgi:hypothetical protein